MWRFCIGAQGAYLPFFLRFSARAVYVLVLAAFMACCALTYAVLNCWAIPRAQLTRRRL